MTQAVIYTVSQPALNAVSFVGGALSALADDLGFTAGQRSASGSLPEYSAPFGKQNAFASGRILGHGAALVAGAVGVAGGGALAGTGVAATTTGVLAPAGAAAVAGGAVIAVAGAAVVTSATANITAGDPNIHFSTADQGSRGDSPQSQKPTSPNQMNKQVERGQAPKGVQRVDNPDAQYAEPHVHFDDGTSITQSGKIHDAGHGTPRLTNAIIDWLHNNGWCTNLN